jgi:hypothetical protein
MAKLISSLLIDLIYTIFIIIYALSQDRGPAKLGTAIWEALSHV